MSLTCLQAAKYWPEACEVIGRPELATDERFADNASLMANARRGARRSWPRRSPSAPRPSGASSCRTSSGQWAMVQDTLEAAERPADAWPTATSHDYETARRHAVQARRPAGASSATSRRRRCGRPSSTSTATRSSTDLGLDWDRIVDLKVRGVVT